MNRLLPRIVLAGRPNVGKSTLFNAWLGEKWSIVSVRPETTRGATVANLRVGEREVLLVDTPGWNPSRGHTLLERRMQHVLGAELAQASLVLLLADARRWTEAEASLVERLSATAVPWGIVLSRIDLLRPRTRLLPRLEACASQAPAARFLIPVSALRGENLERLAEVVDQALADAPLVADDTATPLDDAQLACEIVREKLFAVLRDEVPHGVHVVAQSVQDGEDGRRVLELLILVAREAHKPIVIGRGGHVLRRVGTAARRELVGRWGRPVYLGLWVRAAPGWDDDARLVAQAVAEHRVGRPT